MGESRKSSRVCSHTPCQNHNRAAGFSFGREVSITFVLVLAGIVSLFLVGPHQESQTSDNFPVLFFDPDTHAYVKEHPETLRPANSLNAKDFDPEVLPLSRVDEVISRIAQSNPDTKELWSRPCTINRLTDPIPSFRDFLKENGSQPAIFASGSRVIPHTVTKIPIHDIMPTDQYDSIHSCLCNPSHGTNFDDGGKQQPARYCLWKLGLVPEFVLEQEGNVSNKEIATKLRFQCRIGDKRYIAHTFNRVLKQLLESKSRTTRQFWHSTPFQDEVVMWVSSQDTRTPLHSDDYKQILMQIRGTKHVSVSSDTNLKEYAWAHSGPFDRTLYKSVHEPNQASDQECLLRPGEMLWLPFGKMHDVYSLEPSISITFRYV